MNFKNLKYPLYFFLILFFAKIGYVIVESFYNYYVLYTTTSPELNREVIEELNINGHRISAIGITLLLLPLLFFLFHKLPKVFLIIFLTISSISTYYGVYQGLNILIEKIVEINKEHRHDAYYIGIFKYAILNNIFTYNSFIENEKIQNNILGVNDRILLTNSFLLLHADKKLINKIKERGKEKIADIYIAQDVNNEYSKNFNLYKSTTDDIVKLWNEINKNKNKIKDEIKEIKNEQYIKTTYQDFQDELKKSFVAYKEGWITADEKIKYETSSERLGETKEDLDKYFKYQNHIRASEQYSSSMHRNFGRYIKPDTWKNRLGQVTYRQIEYVIKNEIHSQVLKQNGNLTRGLSFREFLHHDNFKIQVNQKLAKKSIHITYDFDYSFNQYKKFYKIMVTSKTKELYKLFYTNLEKRIGKNDIKLNMNWNQFVYSNFIKSKVKSKIHTGNINSILKAIESKDLSNFKTLVYLPTVIDKVNEMMYKEEDFLDGGKAELKGDEAIKLLYIPPFALAVSILALLLNIVTVIGLLLSLSPLAGKIQFLVKLLAIGIIIALPFISEHKALNNEIIEQSTTNETKLYLDFLSWVSYYEKVNSNVHQ